MSSSASASASLSTAALLSLIQRTLRSTSSLSQSYHHSLSLLQTRLLTLETALTRTLNLEMRLRLGHDWLREKGQLLPSSPLPTLTTGPLSLHSLIFDVFHPSRPALSFATKPFGWDQEAAYRGLVALIRREPGGLLAECVAEVGGSGGWGGGEGRKWVGGLCRAVVCDVLVREEDVLAFLESALRRMHAHMARKAQRKREEEDARSQRNRDDAERRDHAQSHSDAAPGERREDDHEDGDTSPSLVHATSPIPSLTITTSSSPSSSLSNPNHLPLSSSLIVPLPPLSFSVLDHSSLPLKLLHEYNLRYGAAYLHATVSPSLSLILQDTEHMDLNIDLMGPSPRSHSPQSPSPASSSSSSVSSSSEKLFSVCSHLLTAITSSVSAMPVGIRRLTRLLFTLPCGGSRSSDPLQAMHDPSSPHRVTSDYLFLNWLINAVMHPEQYGLLPFLPPLTPLHRRNLQVVATVLIKLMSGSRFVFDSGRLVTLNDFLDQWRGRVVRFIEEVVVVAADDTAAAGQAEGAQAVMDVDETELIAMLPNDLFCLHSMLLSWVKDDVDRGKAERQAERARRKLNPDSPAATPSPSSSSASSHADLVGLLVALDAPPPYLSIGDNLYLLLWSGFPPLAVPALPPFPASTRAEQLCADMLTYTLSLLPTLPSSSSSPSMLVLLADAARREEESGNPSIAIATSECVALLSSSLPSSSSSSSSHQSFLSRLLTHLLSHHSTLLSSPLPRDAVWQSGLVEGRLDNLRGRDAEVMRGLRTLQVRRVMEMVRVKVKRLKKFLAQRGEREKERERELLAASAALKDRSKPTAPSSSPLASPGATYLPAVMVSAQCGGAFPDALNADRFLCSNCMRLLEKRRVLLRSFYTKYVIGETDAAPHSLSPTSAAAPASPGQSSPGPGGPALSTGTEPGEGHALLQLSLGPPLSLLDAAVQADLLDLIVSSTYSEVWVGCERADKVWWVECEAMREAVSGDFHLWYAIMGMADSDLADGVIDLHDVRRMVDDHRRGRPVPPLKDGQSDISGSRREAIERRLRRTHVPYLGSHTVGAVDRELRRMMATTSGREKLDCIARIRSVVFACMSNASMMQLRRKRQADESRRRDVDGAAEDEEDGGGGDGARGSEMEEAWVEAGEVEVGSVDDYMCMLTFLLVQLNPFGLLSHLVFLRVLHAPAATHKPFVDLLTATKALFAMQATLAHVLRYTDNVLNRARGGARGVRSDGEGGSANASKAGAALMVRSVSQPYAIASGKAQTRPHSSQDVHDLRAVPVHTAADSATASLSSTGPLPVS